MLETRAAVKDAEGSSSSAGMRAGELLRNINAACVRGNLQQLDVRLEKKTFPVTAETSGSTSDCGHCTAAQTFGAFL